MSQYDSIVLVCLLSVVGTSLRFVRPGTVLIGTKWNGRYSLKVAPEVFFGATFVIRMAPWLPWAPTLHFHEDRPTAEGSAVDHLDLESARERLNAVLKHCEILTSTSTLLLMYFLIGVGYVLLSGMVMKPWLVLGITLALIQLPHLILVGLVHARLHPGKTGSRVQHLFTMAMFPPEGIFSADIVTSGVSAGIHPLVATLVLCPEKEARQAMADYLRRWKYPLQSEDQDQAAAYFAAAQKLVAEREWSGAELLLPPEPDGPSSRGYCPRCLSQFTSKTSLCPDCPGVATILLPQS